MREETFDLVALVILTALIISLGYNSILKERKATEAYNQTILEDKNVSMVEGVIIPLYGDYDGTLTNSDLVLMSQIQDFYMPEPKTLKVKDAGDVTITSTIEAEKLSYGITMMDLVERSGGIRFTLSYNNGKDYSSKEDDYFYIEKVR